MEIENPQVGNIRLRITKGGQPYKQIYLMCPDCGIGRWSKYENKKARNPRCINCANNIRYTPERAKKISDKQKDNWKNPAIIKRHLEGSSKPSTKLKLSKSLRVYWDNPEFAEKQVKKMAKGQHISPNTSETIMIKILSEYFPNQWRFVGDKKKFFGTLNPDFINDESKLLIECFGDYWHTKRVKYYHQTEQGRKEHYDKYGHKTLILWEHEIKKMPVNYIIDKINLYFAT
jgi:G:T-mismatch repair DNA endonuclease (very short patch repair protein)